METPQPRQMSVSGRLVIEGQLPAPSSAGSENAPAPPSPPWWKFWRGPPETVLAKISGIASLATVVLAAGTVGLALVSYCQLIDSLTPMQIGNCVRRLVPLFPVARLVV